MPLTRDFKQTIVERARREPAFARALLDEAASLFLNGDSAAPITGSLANGDPGTTIGLDRWSGVITRLKRM